MCDKVHETREEMYALADIIDGENKELIVLAKYIRKIVDAVNYDEGL